MHPIILRVFDETFHQEIWGTFIVKKKIDNFLASPNSEMAGKCFTNGFAEVNISF